MKKANEGSPATVTPSMDRGAIDGGHTGEKVAGFDPATAPMETDAEAGGTPTVQPEVKQAGAIAGAQGASSDLNAASTGSAMRGEDKLATEYRRFKGWAVAIIVVGMAMLVAVFIGGSLMVR